MARGLPGVSEKPAGTLGFACHWTSDRERTWSGTPWLLRAALAQRCELVDVGAELPVLVRSALRAAGMRRHDGRWRSLWRHSLAGQALVAAQVRRRAGALDPDVVLQVGDLAVLDRPNLVLQDLSYDLLLAHHGPNGTPHFRTLGRTRMEQLRERQHRVYAGATALLPMSTWLAEDLVRSGVSADRVHVVRPAVNVPLDDGPVPERRTGTARRLLFVGRDFDTKAGDQVVAALAVLRRNLGPHVSLTVAGPAAWPLPGAPPEGVDFLGSVPTAAVRALYETHDLFVMPSHFEGYGIVFVEALSRGLPCVGRRACAMPEIILPGSGGALVDSEDPVALAELVASTLADDDLYAACAAAAPAVRAAATWERAAEDVLRVAVAPRR